MGSVDERELLWYNGILPCYLGSQGHIPGLNYLIIVSVVSDLNCVACLATSGNFLFRTPGYAKCCEIWLSVSLASLCFLFPVAPCFSSVFSLLVFLALQLHILPYFLHGLPSKPGLSCRP
jgi:hypothetical protein